MKRFFILFSALFFGILILLQFIPKRNNNIGNESNFNSIEAVHNVPATVKSILEKSCFDCHSNHTNYPWYSSIQPVSLWLNHHIDEGKEELNFSAFGNYSVGKKHHKLEEMIEQIEENEMPLSSYTLIHGYAKLNSEEKDIVISWAKSIKDSIEHVYPTDSLVRRKRG